jgi:putative PIN family toxin of toxin-antitoxin system
MRVVVDTNVFVSSFFGGHPRAVIDLWKSGKITLCLSKEILDEYVRVLLRMGLEEEGELAELLALFARACHSVFIANPHPIHVVKEDPADDKFFACAVALKANCIISGDEAVLRVGAYAGIRVVRPREFLLQVDG